MHPNADQRVYITIKGVGVIAALGSSNPISIERHQSDQRGTHRGRCLVMVRSGDQPGEIYLHAQADGLDGAETTSRVI